MHLPVAGYRRYPPRRFVFSSSAAPTAPPGSAFLASPGCHRFHLDLHCPQRLANTDSLNGLAPMMTPMMTTMMTTTVAWGLRVVHAKVPKTTLLPSSRFKPPLADC